MTFDQFVQLERVANRAINAAKVFADNADKKQLNELSSVIAEIRHAAMMLCDRTLPDSERQDATLRLCSLFTSV